MSRAIVPDNVITRLRRRWFRLTQGTSHNWIKEKEEEDISSSTSIVWISKEFSGHSENSIPSLRSNTQISTTPSISIHAIWCNCGSACYSYVPQTSSLATNDPSGCVIAVRVRIVRVQRGYDRAECKYEVGVSPSRKRVPPSCWQFRGASVLRSPESTVRQQGIQNE